MKRIDSLPLVYTGIVAKGRGLGTALGYPTANVVSSSGVPPDIPYGVYIGWTTFENKRYPSMMSFGLAETVTSKDIAFEVHLLGYQGDLYHKKLSVEVTKFLRSMKKFDSLEKLVLAMKEDEVQAKKILEV